MFSDRLAFHQVAQDGSIGSFRTEDTGAPVYNLVCPSMKPMAPFYTLMSTVRTQVFVRAECWGPWGYEDDAGSHNCNTASRSSNTAVSHRLTDLK